jgi:hypothetical protein
MKNGKIISKEGDQLWYLNDNLHREDGPAVIDTQGTQAWFLNGKKHRLIGPAIIYLNGSKEWFINDRRHNSRGPAFVSGNGKQDYYCDGVLVTKQEWWNSLHDDDKLMVIFNGENYE